MNSTLGFIMGLGCGVGIALSMRKQYQPKDIRVYS
jgi:hypothetical protein